MLRYHSDKIVIRPLKRSDVKEIDYDNKADFDYVSRHWWW